MEDGETQRIFDCEKQQEWEADDWVDFVSITTRIMNFVQYFQASPISFP